MNDDVDIAHKHFGTLVRLLDKPAFLLDRNGHILSFNETFCNALGQTPNILLGHDLACQLVGTDQDAFVAFRQRCKIQKSTEDEKLKCSFEFQITAMFLSVSPLYVDGCLAGFLCQEDVEHSRESLRLQYLMGHLDQGVWDYDTKTNTLVVSDAWHRMRGHKAFKELSTLKKNWLSDIHPDDQATLMASLERQKRGEDDNMRVQYRHKHADGHWVWILCCAKVMEVDQFGMPSRIVGTDTDITKVKQNDEEIEQLVSKLGLAIDASGLGVWEFDPNAGTVHWDDRMLEIYGLTDGKNDRSGVQWETFLHPDDADEMLAYSEHCQQNGLDFAHDYRVVRPDGEVRHIRSRASQVAVPNGQPKLIGVNIDMTEDYLRTKELEQARAQLQYDSRHDALTGLGNRRLLDETTAAFFENVCHQNSYAVLHLDLDFFKVINDTLGHAAGDAVLVEVAKMLKDIIGHAGLVCRIGGDEFAVFFEKAPGTLALRELCAKVVEALEKPIIYQGHACNIGVSIGCALGRGPTESHAQIFMNADAALYAAKDAGRNCFRVYSAAAQLAS